MRQMTRAVRTGTHLHSARPLRERLAHELGDRTFADLAIELQVCAASIERAAEHWFTSGRVVDAVVASAAVPGLLRPGGRRRRALPRRRHRQLDPGRPRRRVRRRADLRPPGRPRGQAVAGAPQAVGGRAGVFRDRPPAPLPPRDGGAARRRRPPTCCRPAGAAPRTTACCPTATSAPCCGVSTVPMSRPRTTSTVSLRETAVPAGGPRPGGDRGDGGAAHHDPAVAAGRRSALPRRTGTAAPVAAALADDAAPGARRA